MLHNSLEKELPAAACIDTVFNPVIDHWSHFRCGSYTSEWVAQAVGIETVPSNLLLPGPVWFDIFRPITPSDMRKLFKAKGMISIEMRLNELSDADKIAWIKTEIAVYSRPPVLLIRTATLHWLAVGGYDDDKKTFYIYDSRVVRGSVDSTLPIGNAVMSFDELLTVWRGRFFWNFVAITITNVQARDIKKEKMKKILEAYARGELVHRSSEVESKLRPFS
jgi:hypothetical protein